MNIEFKVRFEILKETDDDLEYYYEQYHDYNLKNLIDQVIDDWNGTGDCDNRTVPMSHYLIEDLKSEKGIDVLDLTLMMKYDKDISDGEFIITLNSSVEIPTDYVLNWLKFHFSDGFDEKEYSRVDKYIKDGDHNNEDTAIFIREYLTFDVFNPGRDVPEVVVTQV